MRVEQAAAVRRPAVRAGLPGCVLGIPEGSLCPPQSWDEFSHSTLAQL